MTETFAEMAGKIIRDSIVSAIYIDDEAVEPFVQSDGESQPSNEISKKLYESFRAAEKTIDFYRFRKTKDWKEHKKYLFKNRDLIILDWQLHEPAKLIQTEALEILREAVKTDGLHFVSIYTTTPAKDFPEIFYLIKFYFHAKYDHKAKKVFEGMLEELDNEGLETDFLRQLGGAFKALSLSRGSGKNELREEINKKIGDQLGENVSKFYQAFKTLNIPKRQELEVFGYYVNEQPVVDSDLESIPVEIVSGNYLIIRNTVIQITNKKNPAPEELFAFFTEAIRNACGNILTLISLEVRNLLRESSGFVGADTDNISDAILYLQKEKKERFLDFLLGILFNQQRSFFDYKSGKLSAMRDDFWLGYDESRGVRISVQQLEASKELFHSELAKLNIYYNELPLRKDLNDIVRFGDVFHGLNKKGESDGQFYLCITAHCDCLHPKANIKFNYYFVSGQAHTSLEEALRDGDNEHNSFIRIRGGIVAIRWNPRPLVLNIRNSKISKLEAKDGRDETRNLEYIATLKESYAQRMANNSFAFAMRVGVDFGSL